MAICKHLWHKQLFNSAPITTRIRVNSVVDNCMHSLFLDGGDDQTLEQSRNWDLDWNSAKRTCFEGHCIHVSFENAEEMRAWGGFTVERGWCPEERIYCRPVDRVTVRTPNSWRRRLRNRIYCVILYLCCCFLRNLNVLMITVTVAVRPKP